MHTHATASAFLQLFATVPAVRVGPADTVGLITPISHLYGTAILGHSLRSGARVVTMTVRPGDLEGYLRMVQEHAVSVAPLTPPVLLALARHPVVDRYDLSSLRLIMTGAAPLPRGVDAEVEDRLGCQVVDILGATESPRAARRPTGARVRRMPAAEQRGGHRRARRWHSPSGRPGR